MTKKQIISGILVSVIILSTLLGYFVFRKKDTELPDIFSSVEVTEVRKGSIVRRITVVGLLLAEQRVDIKPEVRGKIAKINFEEGAFVSKDDVLIEIDDRMFQARLKEAQGSLKFAQVEYDRQLSLSKSKAGLGKKLDESIGALQKAEAQFEAATIELENSKIRAPFDGFVGLRNISIGALVNEQTDLLTLVDMDPIKIDFRLPGTFVQKISRGQDVKVSIDGFPGQMFKATIDSIDPKVDPTDHSIEVRALIPNKRGVLKPGLFGRATVVVGAKDDALLIPESAVLSSATEEYVFIARELPLQNGGMATFSIKTTITTGLSEAGTVEVVRGLSEGDQVVTVGLSKVQDRAPITIVEDIEVAGETADVDDDEE